MSQNPKLRRLTPCHRHPHLTTTTGLCGPCLHERLSLLKPTASSAAAAAGPPPELRRCKTFSGKNAAAVVGAVDTSRRSCDVRGSDSLSSLFVLENDDVEVESSNLGLTCPVIEVKEEDEIEDDDDNDVDDNVDDDDDESVPEAKVEIARVSDFRNDEGEIDFEQGKTMKEFIDLELQTKPSNSSNNRKDFKEIAGSFLGVASVFSKKLRKWRKKHESDSNEADYRRNRNDIANFSRNHADLSLGELRIEDLRGRRLSYTQSEVGDYGLGRRSCDTDPRGSVVLGRASIDCGAFGRKSCDSDPRFSIDIGRTSVDECKTEVVDGPRASWDGYLIGGSRALPHTTAPVVSVIENAMATVYGFDDRVLENGDDKDSSLRRRKGFDRCGSVKTETVVMSEDAKVSPAAIGIFNGAKLLITEKELNEWRLKSLKDDSRSSESFETASKELGSVSSSSVGGKDEKKCRQWSKLWNMWGLLNRRKGDNNAGSGLKHDDIARNGNRAGGALVRSYSTSSSRGSCSVMGSGRADSKAVVKRRQDDNVFDRNRSARYSPNQVDNNGLLRFYLTPLRSHRRSRLGKSRLKKSHSLARSVLKM